MKRLFNRSFLIHYCALGYTINNVVLYSNGLWALCEWLLHKAGKNWQLTTEVPVVAFIAVLGIGFMFSNWKSYYKVIGDYLETARPTKMSRQALFESLGVEHPEAPVHQVIVKEVQELPEQLIEENMTPLQNRKRSKPRSRVHFTLENWDRLCAAFGSILKATASSAAWFTWMDVVAGTWAAIGTTIFFAPACTISQIAFLSLGSSKQQDVMDDTQSQTSSAAPTPEMVAQIVDDDSANQDRTPLLTPRKPATVISINHWDKPFVQ